MAVTASHAGVGEYGGMPTGVPEARGSGVPPLLAEQAATVTAAALAVSVRRVVEGGSDDRSTGPFNQPHRPDRPAHPSRGRRAVPAAGSVVVNAYVAQAGAALVIDTFIVLTGIYPDKESADADYDLVKELFGKEDLVDGYDAAVIERREDGTVKLGRKHETPTRVGGVLGGGVGLATGLVVALFPFAAIGGGLLVATGAGGAVLGAVAGHAAAGMSRSDLKELGEQLDAGQAGLIVVAVADMESRVKEAMQHADKLAQKQIEVDQDALARDAEEASEAG